MGNTITRRHERRWVENARNMADNLLPAAGCPKGGKQAGVQAVLWGKPEEIFISLAGSVSQARCVDLAFPLLSGPAAAKLPGRSRFDGQCQKGRPGRELAVLKCWEQTGKPLARTESRGVRELQQGEEGPARAARRLAGTTLGSARVCVRACAREREIEQEERWRILTNAPTPQLPHYGRRTSGGWGAQTRASRTAMQRGVRLKSTNQIHLSMNQLFEAALLQRQNEDS